MLQLEIIFFATSITDKIGFFPLTIQIGAFESENLNIEIQKFFFEEGYYSEAVYPFTIKPNFFKLR